MARCLREERYFSLFRIISRLQLMFLSLDGCTLWETHETNIASVEIHDTFVGVSQPLIQRGIVTVVSSVVSSTRVSSCMYTFGSRHKDSAVEELPTSRSHPISWSSVLAHVCLCWFVGCPACSRAKRRCDWRYPQFGRIAMNCSFTFCRIVLVRFPFPR